MQFVMALIMLGVGVLIGYSTSELKHHHHHDGAPAHKSREVKSTYIVVKNRAAGSPSVYWGSFASVEEAERWATKHRLIAGVIEVRHPDTPEHEWWN